MRSYWAPLAYTNLFCELDMSLNKLMMSFSCTVRFTAQYMSVMRAWVTHRLGVCTTHRVYVLACALACMYIVYLCMYEMQRFMCMCGYAQANLSPCVRAFVFACKCACMHTCMYNAGVFACSRAFVCVSVPQCVCVSVQLLVRVCLRAQLVQ
jgi:hypothetical protein